jgi:hypothetical protein
VPTLTDAAAKERAEKGAREMVEEAKGLCAVVEKACA